MREYECYVCIVASRSRTLYIGMTSRLQARIADHQNGVFEGFSKDYRCTRLVYFERCTGPAGAILREKQLKGWTRAKKIALIEKTNPTWVDLSEHWARPVESYRWSPEELAALKAGRHCENKQVLRLRCAPLRMTNKERRCAQVDGLKRCVALRSG